MDQSTKTAWVILSMTLIFLTLLYMFFHYLRKDSERKIANNLGYSIGVLKNITTAGTPMSIEVYFDFEANSRTYNGMKDSGKTIGYKAAVIGNQYLMIYDTLNPENCQILFDYPIKDSSDFIRYLEEFKTKPLDMNRYF
uniref:hypothetical protein n=1 Tax=uncultured Dysgonomonas sp. TaxID=206096 RepID=UPI00261D9AAC|nr:hypothetical protein [uncultured Dysgonomonas sp.]